MMRTKFILCLISSALTANTALHALDIPVPFNPQEIAIKAQKQGIPAGLSVTAEGKALKIAAANELALAEAVTLAQSVSVPTQAAGRDVTVMIKLSGRGLKTGGATAIAVAGQNIPLPQGNFGWKTLSAKIKCPADGKLPITICLQNFAGALTIQEPVARIDVPKQLPANLKQKQKQKRKRR